MSLGKVRTRILIIGAWLLGVTTATVGSLWAVSELGQGIIGQSGQSTQQLTSAAVNRALAGEAADPSGSAEPSPDPPQASASLAPDPSPSQIPSHSQAAPSGTLLSSSGGNVVASCVSAGAYLLSWSPQQGYAASSVVRGPAASAKVVFDSSQAAVTMVVTCHGGVPAAATSVSQGWHGDD